jgi:hypothetical protein
MPRIILWDEVYAPEAKTVVGANFLPLEAQPQGRYPQTRSEIFLGAASIRLAPYRGRTSTGPGKSA